MEVESDSNDDGEEPEEEDEEDCDSDRQILTMLGLDALDTDEQETIEAPKKRSFRLLWEVLAN